MVALALEGRGWGEGTEAGMLRERGGGCLGQGRGLLGEREGDCCAWAGLGRESEN